MILTDEQALRVKCDPVSPEEINDLVNKLEHELSHSITPGVGLAAPQIGIAKSIAIIRIPNGPKINLVNPEILQGYDKRKFEGEGCLSFPGMFVTTMRYNEIVVRNMVEPKHFIAVGFVAVVIQHEENHLRNILLPDVAIKESKS